MLVRGHIRLSSILAMLKFGVFLLSVVFFSNTLFAVNIDSLTQVYDGMSLSPEKTQLELRIANAYWRNGDLEISKTYASKAINSSRALEDMEKEARGLLLLGRLKLASFSPFDEVTVLFLKSLKLYDQINDSSGRTDCLLQLGVVNYSLGSYESAVKYLEECVEICPKENKTSVVANYLLGLSYSELGSYNKAYALLQRAMWEYADGDDEKKLMVNAFIGKLLLNQSKTDESITTLEAALQKYQGLEDSTIYSPLHSFLSSAYFQKGEINKAIEHAEYSVEHSNLQSGVIYYLEACETLHKAYAITGNMPEAYKALLNWREVSDSVSGSKIMQRIANQKAQYDYEKEMVKDKAEQELEKTINNQKLYRERVTKNILLVGLIALFLVAAVIFRQRYRISKEKAESEKLLLNILPEDVAQELKDKGKAEAKSYADVTILFTDFKQFTQQASTMSPVELVAVVNFCFEAFDHICEKYEIEKIKTIGDSYMAASGLIKDGRAMARNAVLAALEMNEFILQGLEDPTTKISVPFEMRVGLHTGSVVAGIVGVKKFQYDLWGDTVNTASRMESMGIPGRVNISKATYDLIKEDSAFSFEYRGRVEAKGKGEVDMYLVELAHGKESLKSSQHTVSEV